MPSAAFGRVRLGVTCLSPSFQVPAFVVRHTIPSAVSHGPASPARRSRGSPGHEAAELRRRSVALASSGAQMTSQTQSTQDRPGSSRDRNTSRSYRSRRSANRRRRRRAPVGCGRGPRLAGQEHLLPTPSAPGASSPRRSRATRCLRPRWPLHRSRPGASGLCRQAHRP
jgi:hypothetical protein